MVPAWGGGRVLESVSEALLDAAFRALSRLARVRPALDDGIACFLGCVLSSKETVNFLAALRVEEDDATGMVEVVNFLRGGLIERYEVVGFFFTPTLVNAVAPPARSFPIATFIRLRASRLGCPWRGALGPAGVDDEYSMSDPGPAEYDVGTPSLPFRLSVRELLIPIERFLDAE